MEILAPVGGREQLIAAVRSGADAVYLGAKGFNARQNAENFDETGLEETVRYCHERGVRVHVTLNTLAADDELPALYATADQIAAAGADAVIVQDMAAVNYLRTTYPELPLHASTQAVVHNTESAEFFRRLGFSRVVLARELTLKEIRKIHENVDIELEAFVHGALCMCVSGACYLSSAIGGRSGNRGLCAQPCRLNFRSGEREYALSLKDMSHIKHIRALAEAGVSSFKIEGRMKRPEYVSAATRACILSAGGEAYDEDTLRAVFSRGGFTDGYLTGRRNTDMFGRRGKEDVTAAAKVLKQIENTYHKENPLLKVDFALDVSKEKCTLRAYCAGTAAEISGPGAIEARERGTDEALAAKSLGKLGGTQFFLGEVSVSGDSGLMVPPSVLNSMRREAAEALIEKLGKKTSYEKAETEAGMLPEHTARPMTLWARFFSAGQISCADGYEKIIVPVFEVCAHPELLEKYGEKLIAEAPYVAFPEYEDKVREAFKKLSSLGLAGIYAENVYALELGRELGLEIYGGAGLNILNSDALYMYEKSGLTAATLSFEINMAKAEKIKCAVKRGIVAYGRLPLMRVRNCPCKSERGCGDCAGDRSLTDRKNEVFPVLCENRMYSTVLNCVPLHIAEKKIKNIDYLLLYFTKEDKKQCREIYEDYVLHRPYGRPRTGGLYYRELL